MRTRVPSLRQIPIALRVSRLVDEELTSGADPLELSKLLIERGLETAKQDPAIAYESLTELADRLRALAGRMRS